MQAWRFVKIGNVGRQRLPAHENLVVEYALAATRNRNAAPRRLRRGRNSPAMRTKDRNGALAPTSGSRVPQSKVLLFDPERRAKACRFAGLVYPTEKYRGRSTYRSEQFRIPNNAGRWNQAAEKPRPRRGPIVCRAGHSHRRHQKP